MAGIFNEILIGMNDKNPNFYFFFLKRDISIGKRKNRGRKRKWLEKKREQRKEKWNEIRKEMVNITDELWDRLQDKIDIE